MADTLFCLNGHYIDTSAANSFAQHILYDPMLDGPEYESKDFRFCTECGKPTISACAKCTAKIIPGSRPAFCGTCGEPFPWTLTALNAAKEYVDDISELSTSDQGDLKATFRDLTADTPRTPLAWKKFVNFTSPLSPAIKAGLKEILSTVLSESVKKMMGSV